MRATVQQLKTRASDRLSGLAVEETENGVVALQALLDEGYRRAQGLLAGRQAPDATMLEAELVFACHALWARRGMARDANPWTDQAKDMAELLREISKRDIPAEGDAASEDDLVLDGDPPSDEDVPQRPPRLMA